MNRAFRQILSFTLAVICIVSLLPLNVLVDEAHAATHTIWVRTIPEIYLEHKSDGTVWLNTAATNKKLGTFSSLGNTIQVKDLEVVTNYYDPVLVFAQGSGINVSAWKNGINFSSLKARPGTSQEPLRITNGSSGTSYVGEGIKNGRSWDITITKGKSGRQVVGNYPKSTSARILNISDGWTTYKINFTLNKSSIPSKGQSKLHTVLTWLTYSASSSSGDPWSLPDKPSKPDKPDPPDPPDPVWPDPEPEPEPQVPSKAGASAQINMPANTYSNYKYLSGNLSASATGYDTSKYEDVGTLSNLSINLTTNFGSNSNSQKASSVTTSVNSTIDNTLLNKLIRVNPVQFDYTGSAVAKSVLTNGSSYTYTLNGARGRLTLQNQKPSTKISLQTLYNGNRINIGYYYANTPTDLSVVFDDYEKDKKQVIFYIAKKDSWETKKVEFVYTRDSSGKEDYFIRDDLFEIVGTPTKSLDKFSGQIKFKKPGRYVLYSQVIDMTDESMARYLRDSAEDIFNGSGNTQYIEVRPEPQPPTAIISSPPYAFEDEPFTVTQASTDPNNDIVNWVWTNPIDTADGKEVQSNLKNAGKDGGSITFPTGSAHHEYKITLKVTDATNLSDTAEQVIKVISNVPVAVIKPVPDPDGEVDPNNPDKDPSNPDNPGGSHGNGNSYTADITALKENRRLVLSAADSIAPSSDVIQWNKAKWEFKAISGGNNSNIHSEISSDKKSVTMQFDKPGVYEAKISLSNRFTEENPNHEDLQASTYSLRITVVPDEKPLSTIEVSSEVPDINKGTTNEAVTTFKVNAMSIDGDLLPNNTKTYANKTYKWDIYESTDNVNWTLVDEHRRTYSNTNTEVSVKSPMTNGKHSSLKAVVTVLETFGEPYKSEWLNSDGSWKRTCQSTIETTLNWKPIIEITPPSETYPNTNDLYYDETDIDGDGKSDGKFIRVYEGDTFNIGTHIYDEVPEKTKVIWELSKKTHGGEYVTTQDSGSSWINSSYVNKQLINSGGSLKITLPGIYRLRAYIKDDLGLEGTPCDIFIRVYTLPIGVLETNPQYQYFNDEWTAKENVRFDLRSNPTIVDDEWGVAWHQMDWEKDSWTITGVYTKDVAESPYRQESTVVDTTSKQGLKVSVGQKIEAGKEVHVMHPDFVTNGVNTASSNSSTDEYVYTELGSRLGLGETSSSMNMIDLVAISGINSNGKKLTITPYSDGRYLIDGDDPSGFYSLIDSVKDTLLLNHPDYNIKVFKESTVSTNKELFRTIKPYGYFDGFINTQGLEENRYTVAHFIDYTDDSGNSGTTYLAGSISELTRDKNNKECKVGEIRILDGFDPQVWGEDGSKAPGELTFKGAAKVYARSQSISNETLNETDESIRNSKIKDEFNSGSWTLIAEFGPNTSSWDDILVATLNRVEPTSDINDTYWELKSQFNNQTIKLTQDKHVQFKVEFTNNGSALHHTAVVIRGVGGIYDDSQNDVSNIKTIKQVLESLDLRGNNSTKIIVYATDTNINIQEFNSSANATTDKNIVELRNYLTSPEVVAKYGDIRLLVYSPFSDETSLYVNGLKGKLIEAVQLDANIASIAPSINDYLSTLNLKTDNKYWRAFTFTEPGEYTITYSGTNFAGKTTRPVSYKITVLEDIPPIVDGVITSPTYRVGTKNGGYTTTVKPIATLSLTSNGMDGIKIRSIDRDVLPGVNRQKLKNDDIEYTNVTVLYDANNNGTFTDSSDLKWELQDSNVEQTVDKNGRLLTEQYIILTGSAKQEILSSYILRPIK